MNKLKVTIAKEEYLLLSQRPDEEMQAIADFVAKKVEEVETKDLRFNRTMQATLACINIADHLFTLEEKYKKLEEESKEPMKAYLPLQEEAKRLRREKEEDASTMEKLSNELREEREKTLALEENLKENQKKLLALIEEASHHDEDMIFLQKNLSEVEDKLLSLAKQYQEYKRSNR